MSNFEMQETIKDRIIQGDYNFISIITKMIYFLILGTILLTTGHFLFTWTN